MVDRPDDSDSDEVPLRDLLPAIEFCCWVVVALAPFLYWVNGPPVTTDQMVIQISLVSLALLGGIGLRIYHWRSSRR